MYQNAIHLWAHEIKGFWEELIKAYFAIENIFNATNLALLISYLGNINFTQQCNAMQVMNQHA
jgi:hypothetical protein